MTIPGYVDYQRREFCKDVRCPVQTLLARQAPASDSCNEVRQLCVGNCIHSTYEFHHWLIERGYLVVRPESL